MLSGEWIRSLPPGAPVKWNGEVVGHVVDVRMKQGRAIVTVEFDLPVRNR